MKLDVNNVTFSYPRTPVFQDVSFTAPAGKVTVVIGPNGCGKSTLVKCINGIHRPSAGRVMLGEISLTDASRRLIGQHVGYVPQSSNANPAASVIDFLLLGRVHFMGWRVTQADVDAVFAVLERLGLTDLANQQYGSLSGGQRQQVLICRALLQQPELYLFDEPTSALDLRNQLRVLNLARTLAHEDNAAVVLVLHDLTHALRYADQVVVLNLGQVAGIGSPEEVITPAMIEEVYGVNARIEPTGYVNPLNETD